MLNIVMLKDKRERRLNANFQLYDKDVYLLVSAIQKDLIFDVLYFADFMGLLMHS